MTTTRIALVQQRASEDRAANVARALDKVRDAAAAGAKLVSFAELAFERFHPQHRAKDDVRALAEAVPGPTTDTFAAAAKAHGIIIAINLFERDGDDTYDTSVVIDADGRLLGRTRMIHITDFAGFHEKDYYTPGDTGVPVYETAIGRIGIAICYDRHYPEYMRALALGGADLVLVPQAGVVGEWPEGLYEAEMRVAAFQNGYWVALTNRVGKEDELQFAGESFVCGPDGVVVGRLDGGEGIMIVNLEIGAVARSHARRLFLRDRREELYREWFGGRSGKEKAEGRLTATRRQAALPFVAWIRFNA